MALIEEGSRTAAAHWWLDLKACRHARGESQETFWRRFGIEQSSGSRYESSPNTVPQPLRLLILAFAGGFLSDDDLARLHQSIAAGIKSTGHHQ